jgi:hypothetical protein
VKSWTPVCRAATTNSSTHNPFYRLLKASVSIGALYREFSNLQQYDAEHESLLDEPAPAPLGPVPAPVGQEQEQGQAEQDQGEQDSLWQAMSILTTEDIGLGKLLPLASTNACTSTSDDG